MLSVAALAPLMVDPVPVLPLTMAVVPLYHWYVIVPVPLAETVKLAVPPGHSARLAGCPMGVKTAPVLTVMAACAVASLLATLSTTAVTVLLPARTLAVKVAVAVPVDCMVVCAPDIVPLTT